MEQSLWVTENQEFVDVNDDASAYIEEEVTRVAELTSLVRLRNFDEANVINENRLNSLLYKEYGYNTDSYSNNNNGNDNNSEIARSIRWYHKEPDFYVHKRRKFDFAPVMITKQTRNAWNAPANTHLHNAQIDNKTDNNHNNSVIVCKNEEVTDHINDDEMETSEKNAVMVSEVEIITPLLKSATSSFGIAQRQWETFCWMQENSRSGSSDAVLRRLALDQKLNVPPSLAVLNRTILLLGNDNKTEELMRLMEDCVVDQLSSDVDCYLCCDGNNNKKDSNSCSYKLSTSLSPHTLRLLIYAVGKTHPVRAARLALVFSSILSHNLHADWTYNKNNNKNITEKDDRSSDNNDIIEKSKKTLPVEVWTYLVNELAQLASQALRSASLSTKSTIHSIIDKEFVKVFETVIHCLRQVTGQLDEHFIITFGRCMLYARQPLHAVMALVQEELLTGRNRSPLSANIANFNHDHSTRANEELGAFLSELLIVICHNALHEGQATPPSSIITSRSNVSSAIRKDSINSNSNKNNDDTHTALLMFVGDVTKYAYAREITLTSRAFENMLAVCDIWQSRERVIVLFVAMCVLSKPTLYAFLRFVQVCEEQAFQEGQDIAQEQTSLESLEHTRQTISFTLCNALQCDHRVLFYSWVMQRFDLFKSTMSISNANDSSLAKNNTNKKQKFAKRVRSDSANLDEVYEMEKNSLFELDRSHKSISGSTMSRSNYNKVMELEEKELCMNEMIHELQMEVCMQFGSVIAQEGTFRFMRAILTRIAISVHAHCACVFLWSLLLAFRSVQTAGSRQTYCTPFVGENNDDHRSKETIHVMCAKEEIQLLDELCLVLASENMYEECNVDSKSSYELFKNKSVNDKQIQAWIMQEKQRSLEHLLSSNNGELEHNSMINNYSTTIGDNVNRMPYSLFCPSQISSSSSHSHSHSHHSDALSTRKMHCSILTTSALNKLAESDNAERVYVRMMESYSKKDGALSIILYDNLISGVNKSYSDNNNNNKNRNEVNDNPSSVEENTAVMQMEKLSSKAQVMLLTWLHAKHKWLCIVPYSVTLELLQNKNSSSNENICKVTNTTTLLYINLFHVLKTNGHQRVMLITENEAEMHEASENNVKPAVLLNSLLQRLQKQSS